MKQRESKEAGNEGFYVIQNHNRYMKEYWLDQKYFVHCSVDERMHSNKSEILTVFEKIGSVRIWLRKQIRNCVKNLQSKFKKDWLNISSNYTDFEADRNIQKTYEINEDVKY